MGVPIANRTRVEVEQLSAPFVNTLVHRNDLGGNPTFREVLQRVRATAIDAYVHQDLPFERLVRELVTNRDPSRSPLFQVMFNMANAPMRPVELSGVRVEPVDIERYAAQFDLGVMASLGERSGIAASYSVALFDHGTIERFLDNFVTLLDAATAAPATSHFQALGHAGGSTARPPGGLERQRRRCAGARHHGVDRGPGRDPTGQNRLSTTASD